MDAAHIATGFAPFPRGRCLCEALGIATAPRGSPTVRALRLALRPDPGWSTSRCLTRHSLIYSSDLPSHIVGLPPNHGLKQGAGELLDG